MVGRKVDAIKKAIELARKVAKAMDQSAYEIVVERTEGKKSVVKIYSSEMLIEEREVETNEANKIEAELSTKTVEKEVKEVLDYLFKTLKYEGAIEDYDIRVTIDREVVDNEFIDSVFITAILKLDSEVGKEVAASVDNVLIDSDGKQLEFDVVELISRMEKTTTEKIEGVSREVIRRAYRTHSLV